MSQKETSATNNQSAAVSNQPGHHEEDQLIESLNADQALMSDPLQAPPENGILRND